MQLVEVLNLILTFKMLVEMACDLFLLHMLIAVVTYTYFIYAAVIDVELDIFILA